MVKQLGLDLNTSNPKRIKCYFNRKRVFLLGPSHFYDLKGLSVTEGSQFETPFGFMNTDMKVVNKFKSLGFGNKLGAKIEEMEHSLELQLPFLKLVLNDDAKIVPMLIGKSDDFEKIRDLLWPYFLDEESLFVFSTDFAHWGKRFNFTPHDSEKYKSIYQSITAMDMEGVDAIKAKSRKFI